MSDLVPEKLYRLSAIMENPGLRKKAVVFKGYLERSFDIRRAVVRILEPGGSEGEEWLVAPSLLIDL
jgi:hypothetical protein